MHVPFKNIVKHFVRIPSVAIYRSFIVNLVSFASFPVLLLSVMNYSDLCGRPSGNCSLFFIKIVSCLWFQYFSFLSSFSTNSFHFCCRFRSKKFLFEKSVTIVMKFFKIL